MRGRDSRLGAAAAALVIAVLAPVGPDPAADGGPNHQVDQARPIWLGTTGGNINDRDVVFCCGGTLGALVRDSQGGQFILSNNHVLARTNRGAAGDPIIQPGLIDQESACAQDAGDVVAHLTRFVPIRFIGLGIPTNEVDAAIARVVSGKVSTDGAILDIGPLGSGTLGATVGLAVKKSGRTTGLTRGTVAAVNVTVDVGYSGVCAPGVTQTARFVNQIRIGGAGFSDSGDSGSVVVEDRSSRPRAVGLLFAGGGNSTIANPIGRVLSAVGGISMVGSASLTSAPVLDLEDPDFLGALRIRDRHERDLFGVLGVVGTGLTRSSSGEPTIEVYLDSDRAAARSALPARLEGVPVDVVVTGPFVAY